MSINTYTTVLLNEGRLRSGSGSTRTVSAATPKLAAEEAFGTVVSDRVCLVVEHDSEGKARFTHAFRAVAPPVPRVLVVQA